MALRCDNCHKGIMVGKQHTHHPGVAGGRWKKRAPKTQKIFMPNLHNAKILVNGRYEKMRLCTKCLRRAKEQMKQASKPKETLFTKEPLTHPLAV